jgi:hypothetical protein
MLFGQTDWFKSKDVIISFYRYGYNCVNILFFGRYFSDDSVQYYDNGYLIFFVENSQTKLPNHKPLKN